MIVERSYFSIGWIAARLARQVELALATCDLSSSQYRMLAQLGQGAEVSNALAGKLAITAPTVSVVVDGLVHRGAIERTYSAEDRRRVSLALTQPGRDLLAAADKAVLSKLESIADEFEDEALSASAINGLALWGEALDRGRKRRLAARSNEPTAMPR